MATRSMLRKQILTPVAASAVAASVLLYPRNVLHAESPSTEKQQPQLTRKPIYSDFPPPPPQTQPTNSMITYSPAEQSHLLPPSHPTPTARLAAQIKRARLFTHAHAAAAESSLNNLLSNILHQERTFTNTLASLRPGPTSKETVLPGALYILVATMAGSIITRNRNFVLRGVAPAAVGLTAAWIVLPETMANVAALTWRVEERWPVVARNHLRVQGAVEEGRRWGGEKGRVVRERVGGLVGEAREGVEGWVRKGR